MSLSPARRPAPSRRPSLAAMSALALVALAACRETAPGTPPPTDRLFFPTGVAVVPLATGGSALLVSNSNFDLLYDSRTGGTLLSLDGERDADQPVPLSTLGGAAGVLRMPSMGGPLAVARRADCPGLAGTGDLALVASRYTDEMVAVDLGASGALSCGAGCTVPLGLKQSDPFEVAVKCAWGEARAYVGHLRASTTGEISEVELSASAPDGVPPLTVRSTFRVGAGVYGLAYQPERDRLWVTVQGTWSSAPLNVVKLAVPCSPNDINDYGLFCPRVDVAADVWQWVRGAELRDLAFANPVPGAPRRLFVATQIFDPDLALRIGGRPGYDVGAALLVLDVDETPAGNPVVRLVRIVPLALGATSVAVLPPRPGKGDLVAVASMLEGVVSIYDDDTGSVAKVFALSQAAADPSGFPPGVPQMGKQPFALAVEQRAVAPTPGGTPVPYDFVYVASFLSNTVQVVRLLPDEPSGATVVHTIGRIP